MTAVTRRDAPGWKATTPSYRSALYPRPPRALRASSIRLAARSSAARWLGLPDPEAHARMLAVARPALAAT